MTTILDVSHLPQKEEAVRQVLRDLREKNLSLENDIASLEATLKNPEFRKITGKLYMCADVANNNDAVKDKMVLKKLDRCRQLIEPKVAGHLKKGQVLMFLAVKSAEQNPELYYRPSTSPTTAAAGAASTSKLDSNGNHFLHPRTTPKPPPLGQLIVTGPRSQFRHQIKRTKRALRISDCIVSVDFALVSELVDTTNEHRTRLFYAKHCPVKPDNNNQEVGRLGKQGIVEETDAVTVVGVVRDSFDGRPLNMALTGDWTQVQVVHLPNDPGAGLGFGIVGGTSTGVVVKTVLPGSAADVDGKLRPGDRILQIGRINAQGMSSQQVAGLLRQPASVIEIIVGRPINVTDAVTDSISCWTMATRAALTPASLEEQIQQRISMMQNGNARRESQPITPLTTVASRKIEADPGGEADVDTPDTSSTTKQMPELEDSNGNQIRASTSMQDTDKLGESGSDSSKKTGGAPRRSESSDSKTKGFNASISTERPMSLKNLQEMALTTFCRENWVEGQHEEVNVELHRDPHTGLGITVAGYVHKKEEINGVFVKSLVPHSAAHLSRKIKVHDLIIDVNGACLEQLTHSQSVKTLVKSGNRVSLKMIRFATESPQAVCLKMLHEQETDTQIVDVQSTLLDYKHSWQTKLGPDYEVISVIIKPDKNDSDGGLGVSLEGTVDVVDGTQLCPHHYIESMRKDGPAGKIGSLKAGDELLQVNDQVLYGESHVTVRQALSKAAANSEQKDVRLTLCRKAQHINMYMPSPEQSLPLAYTMLATIEDRMVKAKSESALNLEKLTDSTGYFLKQVSKKLRPRSLEHLSGLAIWNCVPIVVTLEKDSRGLGFSVIDYQDPLHPSENVIVIRALVPGGIAQADGRIVPGDRLLFVNSTDLSRASLEKAVSVLKATPPGLVRLGLAKPVPFDQLHFGSHSPIISRSERLIAKSSSPRSRRRRPHLVSGTGISGASSQEEVWIGADVYRKLNPQLYFPSSGSTSPTTPRSHTSMLTWSPCSSRSMSPCGSPVMQGSWGYDVIFLPKNLERSIKLMKGAMPLGITVDAEMDKGINGCVVKSICSKKAVGRDGRVQVGDYLVKINTESLRNVTNSQAKAILKRTNLIGTQCNVTYITAADARLWKQHFHRESEQEHPVVNRLSPKVFPKFYKSPYLGRRPDGIGNMVVDSSFEEDEAGPSTAAAAGGVEAARKEVGADEATLLAAEKVARQRAASIIDGVLINELAVDLFQKALEDSYLELAVASKTKDWSASRSHKQTVSASPSISSSKSGSIQRTDVPVAKRQSLIQEYADRIESPMIPPQLRPVEPPPAKPEPQPSSSAAEADPVSTANSLPAQPTLSTATVNDDKSPEPQPSTSKLKKRTNFWGEARTVSLFREPNETFGISIVGGRVEVSQKGGLPGTGNTVTGIFIKSVMPESPAGRSGKMFMGDRVINVNDVDLKDATHEYAVQVIKAASNPVKFVVQSLQSFSSHQNKADGSARKIEIVHHLKDEKEGESDKNKSAAKESGEKPVLEGARKGSKRKSGDGKEDERRVRMADEEPHQIVSSQPSTSSSHRESVKSRRLSRLRESMRKKLDPESAAALHKHPDDTEEEDRFCYTAEKITRKYGNLPGEPLLIKLENIPPKGLGLSLAGNRDREKNSVFVVDIKSTSVLPLTIGDELLEINGKVLFGLSHVTATSKIRECCEGDELALLILRRNDAVDDMATTVANQDSAKKHLETVDEPATEIAGNNTLVEKVEEEGEEELENTLEAIPSLSAEMPFTTPSPAGPSTSTAAAIGAATPSCLPSPNPAITTTSSDGVVTRKKSTQMERTVPIETGKETWIEIDKEGKGLGLSIVGGSDTVLGTVVVHEVYNDGAAAVDGRLKPGDQLLEVNGSSLREVSHEQAISILRRTPPRIKLLVYRDVNLQMSLLDPTQIYNIFTIELHKKPGRGLGLSIVGRKNEPGVYVSEIVKGGLAEQDNRLMQGDQILAVNGQEVTNSMQEDVATMLKTCAGKVALKIGRWKLTETANRVHAAVPPSMSPQMNRGNNNVLINNNNGNEGGPTPTTPRADREEVVKENGLKEDRKDVPPPAPSSSWPTPEVTIQDENQVVVHPDLSPVTEEPSSQNDIKSLMDVQEPPSTPQPMRDVSIIPEIHEDGSDDVLISLKKVDGQQWGMGIGKRARGILITSLQPGSTAAERLKVGDRIMAVNGERITDQHSAVTLVKASGNCVVLQVARPVNRPTSGNM